LNHITREFLTKLKKLEQQLTIARLSDFSYPDARDALDILRSRLQHRGGQVAESESFSAATRNAILREINYLISRITAVTGIITRSASVRNAFELYAPFLEICKALVGGDARLILSSEWEFVPFTYPQTLAELPQFIVIGLPASESDNVLVFPAAGHELGHSVWSKHSVGDHFKIRVEQQIDESFRKNRSQFDGTFPDLKGADLEQDMFVQHIKSSVFSAAMMQAEETFSDFMGLLLFGESYLFAFEYLIAPQISGVRSKEYPDTFERAATLEKFAREKLSIDISSYANNFMGNTPFRFPHDNFICAMADEVLSELCIDIFAEAQRIVVAAHISMPSAAATTRVFEAFARGIPYDDGVALGDLINAGWRVFRDGDQEIHASQGHSIIEYTSDLILKSAEIHEIGSILK
jgi:hypothetical protein